MDREKPSYGSAMMPRAAPFSRADLIARFAAIVGERYAITDARAQEPYLVELRGLYHGRTPVVLRPGSVAEVAAVLKLADETRPPIVPPGGNTRPVGGPTPPDRGIVPGLTPLRPTP